MSKRYYARYAGKADGFAELYEVIDSTTGDTLSARQPYHCAILEADARNEGRDIASHVAQGMGWAGFIPAGITP